MAPSPTGSPNGVSHQRRLLHAYQPIRVALGATGVVVFGSAAAFGSWWEGFVAAAFMAAQLVHGLGRMRSPSDDPWPVLLVDITVIGVGSVLIRSLAVVGLAMALLVTVVATLSTPGCRVRAWVYTAVWFAAILAAHETLDGASLPRTTIRWVNLSAVIVFIPSIAVLAAQASRIIVDSARARDEFLASVSHEIRTPLTMVVGLARELSEEEGRFTKEETREFAQLISDQSSELAHIVDDLLVAARADGGELTVAPADLDLYLLVEAAAGDCEPFRALSKADVVVGREGRPHAWADPTRVRQIVRNLLTNALRYGGGLIEVVCGADTDRVFVEVRDNGDGVPEAARERIFRPYERAHDLRGQPGSVGLGLSVSTQLATLMAGDLTYEYADGWSVFRLTLPSARGGSDGINGR